MEGPAAEIHPMDGLEFGFSASGWLMNYQLGVAYAMQRHGVSQSTARFVGASGGAACSAALALNLDAKVISDFMVRCCADFHENPVKHIWRMGDYARNAVQRTIVDSTFQHQALVKEKKLNVAVTLLPSMKGVILNNFNSNDEYLDAIMASCCLAPVAGMPFKIQRPGCDTHNQWVIDGGLAQMIPVLSEKTLTICPLYCFDADITPSRYVPIHWAVYPPSVKEFQELFWLGVTDGMTFLEQRGFSKSKLCNRSFRLHMERDWTGTMRHLNTGIPVSPHSSVSNERSVVNLHSFSVQSRITGSVPTRSRTGSVSSLDSQGSISTVGSAELHSIVQADALRSGQPMSQVSVQMHRVGDGVTVAFLLATVKPIALGVVYAELASKAALSTAAGVFAAVENARRSRVEQTKGILSMRKWVHDGMVGSAQEQLSRARDYVAAVADPNVWLIHIPLLGGSLLLKESDREVVEPKVKETLASHSLAYRLFSRASLW